MIDLGLVKSHCRIDSDFTSDDQLLKVYIEAAVSYVQSWTRRQLYPSADSPGYSDDPDGMLLNDAIKAAILLCISQWYSNREGVVVGETVSEMPIAVQALLQPYRIYGL